MSHRYSQGVVNAAHVGSRVPDAATEVTATKLPSRAVVAFTGITGATSYRVTSTPGNVSATAASSPITVSGLTNGTAYTFKVTAINVWGESVASAASNSVTPALEGQVAYTAGTYTFVVPPGITSVSVVCVGAGGASGYSAGTGGGGGGLRYKNNITVTPGQSINVIAAGVVSFGWTGTNSSFGTSGTDAFYFYAGSGQTANTFGTGAGAGGTGSVIGANMGGGNGGASSNCLGGGGAAGYSGNGGNGGTNGAGSAGSGGGGGGGAGWDPNIYYGTRYYGHGGGVGILGESTSGLGGYGTDVNSTEISKNGQGGSGGSTSATLSAGGGTYGGGSGGDYVYSNSGPNGAGAVRIIYPATGAITRSFPSTNTGNL